MKTTAQPHPPTGHSSRPVSIRPQRPWRAWGAALLGALWLACGPSAHAIVTSFNDITYWVGSGSNQAALVIDWNDGKTYPAPLSDGETLVWGYRWDGAATGEDMVNAIAAAAPASFQVQTIPFPSIGNAVVGFGADLDADGFATTDTADHWIADPAFSTGYWAYYFADGTATLPAAWTSSPVGFGARTLANNSWDGWSWAPDFSGAPPDAPVVNAIPEPTATALLLAGALLALRRRRTAARSGKSTESVSVKWSLSSAGVSQ